jgi:hypothetical protein
MGISRSIALAAATILAAALPAAEVTDLPLRMATPSFTLPDAGGGEVALLNEYGQPIVLVFADLTQENSRQGIADLAAVIGEKGAASVKVYIIVPVAEADPAPQPFPILFDPERRVFTEYGAVAALPAVCFLDASGLLHFVLVGHGVSFRDEVENEIAYLTGEITGEELIGRRQSPEVSDAQAERLRRLLNLAGQMRERGLTQLARERYQEVLDESPGNAEAHLGMAQIELSRGNASEAESEAVAAIQTGADLPLAHKTLALAQLLQGHLDAAAEAIGHFVEIAGEDAETQYLNGRLAEARGDADAAAQSYRAACERLLAERRWGLFSTPGQSEQ